MSGIQVREYTVKESRIVQLSIPRTYTEAVGVKVGDKIEVWQTMDGRLVIQPKGWKPRTEGTQVDMGGWYE